MNGSSKMIVGIQKPNCGNLRIRHGYKVQAFFSDRAVAIVKLRVLIVNHGSRDVSL